ncbi:histidine--tRNA ligase [Candidatus Adlerbacteria bacterium RIFCSPLOWO2_01_FULL_51_16]|uniref:Histidine--tRNA ligase n=1 Tax=Candidatus Adlerbacteria bacterium RIFCSPLOWO2_01_FULL_51_16 TaxID=1797243 RepID=A0A1F4XFN0_9BACT|nr:MAG: histidine--tRNA ligase [Candidatus Adlerbacteria bacterium RIFCSPLOWO2_01_FULL_51_16]
MAKKEKLSVEPYKGVRDFYPEDQAFLNYILATMREVVERFGYAEYHASILEPAELYKGKGVENEEIINDQSYTFLDRGGREVTLRPEMTPTVARMVAGKRRELGFPLRLYSIPNVFRYERPQRGRLREHWQLNVDLFGSNAAAADAEVIAVAYSVMIAFGAKESDFTIKLGSRNFTDSLITKIGLDGAQAAKFRRLLDQRGKIPENKFMEDLATLGVALEMLSPEKPPKDVAEVLSILTDEMGIGNAVFDPGVIRGFNYYTGVVFEVFDTHPDNSRAMFGGGRYENLTALFDEEQVPGVGFGMGDVTIRDFLAVRGLVPPYTPRTRVYLAAASATSVSAALALAGELRAEGIAVAVDFGEKKLGDQIKAAAKHKIPYVIVVGPDEIAKGTYVARNLETGGEAVLTKEALSEFFLNL